jgi:hypothetical protein
MRASIVLQDRSGAYAGVPKVTSARDQALARLRRVISAIPKSMTFRAGEEHVARRRRGE